MCVSWRRRPPEGQTMRQEPLAAWTNRRSEGQRGRLGALRSSQASASHAWSQTVPIQAHLRIGALST